MKNGEMERNVTPTKSHKQSTGKQGRHKVDTIDMVYKTDRTHTEPTEQTDSTGQESRQKEGRTDGQVDGQTYGGRPDGAAARQAHMTGGRTGGSTPARTGRWAAGPVAVAVGVNFASPPQSVPLINVLLPYS